MKLSKKIISIVLSALMVISMLPMTVFAATSASSVTDALNAYSYQPGFTGKYGSYSGDKTSDMPSGVTYETFMRNVLYGETGSTYQTTDTKLKASGGTGSDSNTHVWVKYPRMTLIYDGTSTELNTPVMVQVMSEGENRYVYCAAPANELGLANTSVWYGSDQADNWAWLYSQQKSNDIGQINATAADGKKAQISKTGGFMGIGNYNKKYYRYANMTKFQSSFGANEYYKEISPLYQFYVGSNNTYTQTDIAGTNAVGDPIRYVNYKPIYDRVNAEKANFAQFNAKKYTADSVNAYYDAIIAMAQFDVVNYNSYATHDDVVAAASQIKSLVDAYDTAKAGLVPFVCTTHNWVDTTVATAATCTEKGVMNVVCSICDEESTREILATGHSTSYNSTVKIPATCTTQGTTTYSCKNAGCTYSFDVQDIAVNPNAHNMSAYVASAGATCENDGQETATCQNGCGYSDTRDVTGSKTGHAYPTTWTKEDDTNHIKVCANDGAHVMREAHAFGEYVYNNDATTEADGTETATCVCGATSQRPAEGTKLPAGPDNTANLTLDSEISFNLSIDTDYYLENEFEAGTTADEVEYVVEYKQQTVEVGQPEEGVAINATVDAVVADGKTLIKVETAPAQLTEEISVVLKAKDDSKSVTVLDGYSMKDYCDAVISRNGASKAVCEELVRYAATAQVNFNYNTENMAVDVDAPFISQLNADYTALGSYNTPAAVSNDINVAITGVSYVALSDATVRFYLDKTNKEFYAANGCTYGECELTMTMEDQTGSKVYTPYFAMAEGSDEVYIAVPGIESANLDNTFHITMTTKSGKTMTIDYAATTFCKSAVANAKTDELKNLAKAIVLYNDAANKRFV